MKLTVHNPGAENYKPDTQAHQRLDDHAKLLSNHESFLIGVAEKFTDLHAGQYSPLRAVLMILLIVAVLFDAIAHLH